MKRYLSIAILAVLLCAASLAQNVVTGSAGQPLNSFLRNSAIGLPAGTDLNTIVACGNWDIIGAINGPAALGGEYARIRVDCSSIVGYVTQTAYAMTQHTDMVWQRRSESGTWFAWYQIWPLPVVAATLPKLVASIPSTTYSSTATIGGGSNVIYTTPNDSIIHAYRFCSQQVVSVVGTAGTFQLYPYAVLGGINRATSTGISIMTVTSTVNYGTGCVSFDADSNSGIRMADYANAVTGTPTILYSWTIEMMR